MNGEAVRVANRTCPCPARLCTDACKDANVVTVCGS